jgi:hypothetical protein
LYPLALVAIVRSDFPTDHQIVGLLQREHVLYVQGNQVPPGRCPPDVIPPHGPDIFSFLGKLNHDPFSSATIAWFTKIQTIARTIDAQVTISSMEFPFGGTRCLGCSAYRRRPTDASILQYSGIQGLPSISNLAGHTNQIIGYWIILVLH